MNSPNHQEQTMMLGLWQLELRYTPERIQSLKTIMTRGSKCWDHSLLLQALLDSVIGSTPGLIGRIEEYINNLTCDVRESMMNEYADYHICSLVEGVLFGIGAYMTFLWLNECHELPFYCSFPYTLDSGMVFNRAMFQLVSAPLLALIEVSHDSLLALVRFTYSFVNLNEDLFYPGPEISVNIQTTIAVQTIIGMTRILTGKINCMSEKIDRYAEESSRSRPELSVGPSMTEETIRLQQIRLDKLENRLSQSDTALSEMKSEMSRGMMTLASEFSERSARSERSEKETPQVFKQPEISKGLSTSGWRKPDRYQVTRY